MKVFPYSLVRISGSRYNDLKSLCIDSVYINEYYELQKKQKKLQWIVIDLLYKQIGRLKNKNHQNYLLNLKRDVYNDRIDFELEIVDLRPLLTKDLERSFRQYLSTKQLLNEYVLDFEKIHTEECQMIREQFKKLIKDPVLQNGLLLSSNNLLKRIYPYTKKTSDQISRNDVKAELGLLKYFTRIKTKTSPFSTFTNLAVASHTQKMKENFFVDTAEPSVVSHIRLNNAMFEYLESLLFNYSEAYLWFSVCLNSTIRTEENTIIFLTNHKNSESFQRIPFKPFISLIKDIMGDSNKHELTFQKLIQTLTEHVAAPQHEISEYLKKLIDFGFLEFDIGISRLDPDWDLKLRETLLPLEEKKVPLIAELRLVLKQLRKATFKIETTDFQTRKYQINKAFKLFKKICARLHEEASLPEEERLEKRELQKKQRNASKETKLEPKEKTFSRRSSTKFRFKPETIFYEDTFLKTPINVSESSVQEIVRSMDGLLQYIQPFESWREEDKKMVDYFMNQYSKGESVSLLLFYENYYRDIKKPEEEKKKQNRVKSRKRNPLSRKKHDMNDGKKMNSDSPREENLYERWQNNIGTFLDPELFQKGTIQIKPSHLEYIAKKSLIPIEAIERTSFGMFIQFFNEKDEESGKQQLKGVINGVFPGFGRMISRFLYLFDEDLTKEIRSWNRKLAYDDVLIENNDASCFNANIHPPLMAEEIQMPGSQYTLPTEKQVPITELFIQEDNGKLYLKNKKKNKIVYTFDLGFQGSKGRSPLFQLLSRFTLAKFLSPYNLISAVNSIVLSKKDEVNQNNRKTNITVYPRIVYDNKLVLQRKVWSVPVPNLPVQQQESDSSYFLRMNQWRKSHGIPDEVFITFFSKRDTHTQTAKKDHHRVGHNDYKPQYIDFNNPLLVNLFSKLVRKVISSIKIVEMLPRSDQLFRVGNQKYVTEHMVQWYYF